MTGGTNSVFVGSTAYNWLVLYRESNADGRVNSRRLVAECREQADWAYAVLGSGLVYWLWRVEGDGFHVPADMVGEPPLPVGRMRRRRSGWPS